MGYKYISLNINCSFCLILCDICLMILCWLMWSITTVYFLSKQFSEEKEVNMSALSATVGGLSDDIPVGLYCPTGFGYS